MASVEHHQDARVSSVPTLKALCMSSLAESTLDTLEEQPKLEAIAAELGAPMLIAEFMIERDAVRRRMEAHRALDALGQVHDQTGFAEATGHCGCGCGYFDGMPNFEVFVREDCCPAVRACIDRERAGFEQVLRQDEQRELRLRRRSHSDHHRH